MKICHFLFLLYLLFPTPNTLLSQDPEPAERYIDVTGTATAKAEVDQVAWNISIRSEAGSLTEAMKQLDEATSQLQGAIAALANESVDLRFSRIRSGKLYRSVEKLLPNGTLDKEEVLAGYFIERAATVRSGDLDVSPQIETILLKDEQIQIGALNLTSSQYEELKKRAVLSAVEAAKEKAELMVSVFPEAKLGPILQMREGNSSTGSGSIRLTENRIEMPVFHHAHSTEFDLVSITATVSMRIALD